MSRPASASAALPIAYVVLRILIVANWLMAAAILALLFAVPNEQWIMSAFKLSLRPTRSGWSWACAPIAVLGLAAIPLNYTGLKRLLAIVESVRTGDPFVAANASRCRRSRGRCSRCSSSAWSSAPSARPFQRRRIR